MECYQKGNLAKSIAGHDKGEIYMIVREEGEWVYLVNGKNRRIECPKCKRKKHIQPIYQKGIVICQAEQNEAIKRMIRQYQKSGRFLEM